MVRLLLVTLELSLASIALLLPHVVTSLIVPVPRVRAGLAKATRRQQRRTKQRQLSIDVAPPPGDEQADNSWRDMHNFRAKKAFQYFKRAGTVSTRALATVPCST